MPSLPADHVVFHSITSFSDNEYDIVFRTSEGYVVSYRFTVVESSSGLLCHGERRFEEKYRRVPGPAFSTWPEKLVLAAHRAVAEPFPDGAALDATVTEVREELARRWARDTAPE